MPDLVCNLSRFRIYHIQFPTAELIPARYQSISIANNPISLTNGTEGIGGSVNRNVGNAEADAKAQPRRDSKV